jgi:hypothetical protein
MPINIPIPQSTHQAVIAVLVFLFVMWLIHRIENRIKSIAQNVAYNNFPFLRRAVDSFQTKLDHLISRVDALEDRIYNLEKNKTKNI